MLPSSASEPPYSSEYPHSPQDFPSGSSMFFGDFSDVSTSNPLDEVQEKGRVDPPLLPLSEHAVVSSEEEDEDAQWVHSLDALASQLTPVSTHPQASAREIPHYPGHVPGGYPPSVATETPLPGERVQAMTEALRQQNTIPVSQAWLTSQVQATHALLDPSLTGKEASSFRHPPANLEAEQAILGAILVDPDSLGKIVDMIQPKDFYRKPHAILFDALRTLYERGEPVDVVTVSEFLDQTDHLDLVGGRAYINDLSLMVVTTENVVSHARVVRNKAILRTVIRLGQEMAFMGYESHDGEAALDVAQQALFELARSGGESSVAHVRDILPITFEQIEERFQNKGSLMGIDTGFYELNQYTSGLQPSDLIILAARPSMGKTAFCLNILNNVALLAQKPVMMFSLEMSKESVITRMLCAEAGIDQQRIRTGDLQEYDFQQLSAAMGRLGDAPIFIDDSPGVSVMDIRAKMRKVMLEHRIDQMGLIVIDYLQLMESRSSQGGGENRQQEVSAISRGLKALAREFKVPVMALSQLSRAVESRIDKKPMLSDLRESGSIEQDADLVMFIYRDEYYNKDSERPGFADIIIAKQRNGPVGEFELLFKKNVAKFVNPKEIRTRTF
ncbi:MAG: replicative DNA helicase [Vampirovibrionales bacterium]